MESHKHLTEFDLQRMRSDASIRPLLSRGLNRGRTAGVPSSDLSRLSSPPVVPMRTFAFTVALLTAPATSSLGQSSLMQARQQFQTTILGEPRQQTPLPRPPHQECEIVQYQAPLGKNWAYLHRPPRENVPAAAILWITGGFPVARGGENAWRRSPDTNEQSAAAFRESGIAMMFPTIRGTCDNPGRQESFYGEVEDILAAAEYLRQQEFVDPNRVYLGGHSTGATLALLTAEASDRFRAVFCFGPAAEANRYGTLTFDSENPKEWWIRSPIHFLDDIVTPTFVIEGEAGRSQCLRDMADACLNPEVTFALIPGSDHFLPLGPVTHFLAQRVLQTHHRPFEASVDEILQAYESYPGKQQNAKDRERLERMRNDVESSKNTSFHRVDFFLEAATKPDLEDLRNPLETRGFRWQETTFQDHGDHRRYQARISQSISLARPEQLFETSGFLARLTWGTAVVYESWQATAVPAY